MMWETINIACRLMVAAIVIVKLVRFYDLYRAGERFGLGVAGGCALLTVPVLWEGQGSPFAEWASALFAFGVAVYFAGRLRRQMLHERANREMVRKARERGL